MEFIWREGTKDYGREYQTTLITLFALRLSLDQEVRNVLIASNAKDYGLFNHAIIRIDYDEKKSKAYGICFEYRMYEDSGVTTGDFSNKNGDFSLQKYKESYHKLFKKKLGHRILSGISADDVTLCLCTNTRVTGCNVFPLETSLLNCRISPSFSPPNDFVCTNSKGFYRFQIVDLPQYFANDAEETEDFFAAQANNPFDNPKYAKFIQDPRFLENFDEDESLLADLAKDELKILPQERGGPNDEAFVSPKGHAGREFELNKKEQEYADFFHRFLFYNNQVNYRESLKEIGDLLESSFNAHGIAKQLVQFVKARFDIEKSLRNTKSKLLLHKKVVKLKLFELLSGIEDGEELKAKYEVFKGITNMNDYTQRVRVLKEIKVSLQGRTPSSLYELTQESFHRTISVPFLLKNVMETVQVGLNANNNKPAVYIRRRFRKVLLKRSVLWETRRNIFIFDDPPPSDSGVKIRELTHEEMESIGDDNLVTAARKGELDELIRRIEAHHLLRSFPLHHLAAVESGLLEWRNSWRGVEDLSGFIVDGEPLSPDRTVDEADVLEYFPKKPLNVISASPGMGKSTMLNVLLGYCQPDVLVLTLNLKTTPSVRGASELLDYLCEQAMCRRGQNEEEFERGLFQFLKQERRLVLFVDASDDEVPPTIIEYLQELEIPVWVFTRPASLCEKHFSVLPITLASLTREDMAYYLKHVLLAPPEEVNNFLATDTFVTLFRTPLYLHELVKSCEEWRNLRALKATDLHERFVELSFENYMRNYNTSKEFTGTLLSLLCSEGNFLPETTCLRRTPCAEYLAAVGILEHPKKEVLYETLLKKEFEPVRILFDMISSAKDDHL